MSNIIIGAADPNKRIKDIKDAEFVDIQAGIRYRQTRAPEGNTWNVVERDVKTYFPQSNGSAVWGSITGSITSQTDLKNALDSKQNITISGYSLGTVTPVDNGQTVTQAFGNVQAQINNINTVAAGKLDGDLTSGRIPFATGPKTLSDTANLAWNSISSTVNLTGSIFALDDTFGYSIQNVAQTDGVDITAYGINIFSADGGFNQMNVTIDGTWWDTGGSLFLTSYTGASIRRLAVDTSGELIIDTNDYPTGTAVANQVTFWTGTSTQGGSANFVWNNTTNIFSIIGKQTISGSITASSASARGLALTNTLVAAANNDVLSQIYLNPVFTNGAFTGVGNYALYVASGSNRFIGKTILGSLALTETQITGTTASFILGATDVKALFVGNSAGSDVTLEMKPSYAGTITGTIGYLSTVSGFLVRTSTSIAIFQSSGATLNTHGSYITGSGGITGSGARYFAFLGDNTLLYRGAASTNTWTMSNTLQSYLGDSVFGGATQQNNATVTITKTFSGAALGLTRYATDSRFSYAANTGNPTELGNSYKSLDLNNTTTNAIPLVKGDYLGITLASTHTSNTTVLYGSHVYINGNSSAGLIATGNVLRIETVGVNTTNLSGIYIDVAGTVATNRYSIESVHSSAKLYHAGDIEIYTVGKGYIAKSPDGTRWKITVTNAGAISIALA